MGEPGGLGTRLLLLAPVSRLNFGVWLFLAYLKHVFGLFRSWKSGNPGFILKFELEYWINILVKNGRKKEEIVPIVHDLYDILIGKS